ncbi:hypothetical protein DEO72_LG4g238 [Vigna unguiculata]|uniref:Uncharacterized protein n=1 Tax=Vigna unguiculata TaxID=3917 RepID=A0A4D6LMN4_VIGUN|nr:hypothetical protein DEO72_LG4g238 [Vigna unguiculata]
MVAWTALQCVKEEDARWCSLLLRMELRVLARRCESTSGGARSCDGGENDAGAVERAWFRCSGEDGGGVAVRTKMVDNGRRWRRDDGGAAEKMIASGTVGWFVVAVASPAMVGIATWHDLVEWSLSGAGEGLFFYSPLFMQGRIQARSIATMSRTTVAVNGIEEEEKNDAEKMMSLTGVVVDD